MTPKILKNVCPYFSYGAALKCQFYNAVYIKKKATLKALIASPNKDVLQNTNNMMKKWGLQSPHKDDIKEGKKVGFCYFPQISRTTTSY
jgi:hypothetical protein